MKDVLFIPELRLNLFSITKEMKEAGAKLTNEGDRLILTYPDGRRIVFDHKMKTMNGFVMTMIIKPFGIFQEKEELKTMKWKRFHELFGHQHKGYMKETAKQMGYKLTGKLSDCIHCAQAKIN